MPTAKRTLRVPRESGCTLVTKTVMPTRDNSSFHFPISTNYTLWLLSRRLVDSKCESCCKMCSSIRREACQVNLQRTLQVVDFFFKGVNPGDFSLESLLSGTCLTFFLIPCNAFSFRLLPCLLLRSLLLFRLAAPPFRNMRFRTQFFTATNELQ